MLAEVKVLIEGITNADSVSEIGEERTRPTISLVKEGDFLMIVDPGILESQQVLIDALECEGLTPDDIDVVCITHSHLDHYRNVGMFSRAKTLEYFGLWKRELVEDWPEQFSPHIQILKTPGHDYTGITLFVTTVEGVVAICGDVFWKKNYPKNAEDDLYASDPKKLKRSRELVLEKADYIIPGHGGMFKVKNGIIDSIKNTINATKPKAPKTLICKNCGRTMRVADTCICRPWLCYKCCLCGIDCDTCSCSHKNK